MDIVNSVTSHLTKKKKKKTRRDALNAFITKKGCMFKMIDKRDALNWSPGNVYIP